MLVVGFAVSSLDGCLTRHDEPGTGFGSPEDRWFFRAALEDFDSVIAGRKTFEASRTSPLWARTGSSLRTVLTSSPERFAEIERPGELEFRNADVARTIRDLEARGHERCGLLGGARLFTDACHAKLLDELWITLEPLAFGEGAQMFEGRVDFRFELKSSEALSANTVLLKYRRA